MGLHTHEETTSRPGFDDARRLVFHGNGLCFCYGPVDGWCQKGHQNTRELEDCLSAFRAAHGGRSDRKPYTTFHGFELRLDVFRLTGEYCEAGGVYADPGAEAR